MKTPQTHIPRHAPVLQRLDLLSYHGHVAVNLAAKYPSARGQHLSRLPPTYPRRPVSRPGRGGQRQVLVQRVAEVHEVRKRGVRVLQEIDAASAAFLISLFLLPPGLAPDRCQVAFVLHAAPPPRLLMCLTPVPRGVGAVYLVRRAPVIRELLKGPLPPIEGH